MTKRERDKKIVNLRAKIEVLEAEHKDRIKDGKVPPEVHLQGALRIGELRIELRQLEGGR